MANGRVPFYDQCLLGMSQDLRGYEAGATATAGCSRRRPSTGAR